MLATANYDAVEAILNDMPRPQVDTTVRGFQGDGTIVDPAKEIEARVTVLMTEKKMRYADALSEVLRVDTHLAREYDKRREQLTAK